MKPIRWKKETVSQHPYDAYDIIDLYKAKIITKEEARVLFFGLVKDSFFND